MAVIGGEIEHFGQVEASFDGESRTGEEMARTTCGQLQTIAAERPAVERSRSMWSGEFAVSLRELQAALVDSCAKVSRRQTALLRAGS